MAWKGRCADQVSKAWATIIVKRNTSHTTSTVLPRTCINKGGWRSASVKVTAGHSYTVQLISHDDGLISTPNRSYFDDVTVS